MTERSDCGSLTADPLISDEAFNEYLDGRSALSRVYRTIADVGVCAVTEERVIRRGRQSGVVRTILYQYGRANSWIPVAAAACVLLCLAVLVDACLRPIGPNPEWQTEKIVEVRLHPMSVMSEEDVRLVATRKLSDEPLTVALDRLYPTVTTIDSAPIEEIVVEASRTAMSGEEHSAHHGEIAQPVRYWIGVHCSACKGWRERADANGKLTMDKGQ